MVIEAPAQHGTPVVRAHDAAVATSSELDAWLAQVAVGDRSAFESLYAATAPRVLGLAERLLGERDAAEQAVQDTFVQAWREAARFPATGLSGMAWLLRLAHAHAVEQLRARAAAPDASRAAAAVSGARTSDAPGAGAAVAMLPATEREAIELAYLDGLTLGQIALRLGLSLEDAAARIGEGMRRLHGTLGAKAA